MTKYWYILMEVNIEAFMERKSVVDYNEAKVKLSSMPILTEQAIF